ncbi:MAG: glycoside hydrolase, family 20, partial [Acidimicrobiales bacterium]|nr:glycoside hydrolase, family 20 [Acidimicrobiales bacterium]
MNLLPRPRSLTLGEGRVPSRPPAVAVDRSLPAQGYRLEVKTDAIELAASDDAGQFYGQATLEQLRRLHGDELPPCSIIDWPDAAVRGVMLDVSRDKVPTMQTVEGLVDRLASWKVNQVHLYMEHTFAYQAHGEVWAHASPFTAEEVRRLDAFCRARHVELVPNQNCLGHMGRWLKHERYRPLAIFPDGWERRGRVQPPTTLDPAKPGSLELVRALLAELLPNFSSERVHVGLDEPFEMPRERLDEYGRWITTMRDIPELDGREMLVWGDILAERPDLLDAMPDGVTVCEWGYEDWHPFDRRSETLSAAGRPFWVCPGTSSWLTVLGRTTNMMGNCRAAAEAARDHGAPGVLNTDWGDLGHLQYLPVSEPGLAYGAAVSWCLDANADLDRTDLAAALDAHAFDDPAAELGSALLDLGDAYRGVEPSFPNLSVLVMHLYFPQLQLGRSFTDGLTTADLAAVEERLTDAVARLARARSRRADGGLVVEELSAGAALVSLMCRDARARLEGDGWLASVPERRRRELAAELEPLIETHRRLWLARNRPGGLDDSAA